MPAPKRGPGRPAALRSPSDFGQELTFEELGACLGMSRYRAKVLVIDNGVPVINRGKVQTVHQAVAQKLATGEWWINQARA